MTTMNSVLVPANVAEEIEHLWQEIRELELQRAQIDEAIYLREQQVTWLERHNML